MQVKVIKKYDKDLKKVQIDFPFPSLTSQDFKDECDISYIIESYVKRGLMPTQSASYFDCTSVQDYQTAMMTVAECKSNFEALPSSIRDEFLTVENYLEYIADKNNLKDCIDRGLIDKSTVPDEVVEKLYSEFVTTPSVENPVVKPEGENVSANS